MSAAAFCSCEKPDGPGYDGPDPVDNPTVIETKPVQFGIKVEDVIPGTSTSVKTFGKCIKPGSNDWNDYRYFLTAELTKEGQVTGGHLDWDAVHLTPNTDITFYCYAQQTLTETERKSFKVNAESSNGNVQVVRVNDTTFTLKRLQDGDKDAVITLWTGDKDAKSSDKGCKFTVPVHAHTSVKVTGFKVKWPNGDVEELKLYDYDTDLKYGGAELKSGKFDTKTTWRPVREMCNVYNLETRNYEEYLANRKFYGKIEFTVIPFYATNDQTIVSEHTDLFTYPAKLHEKGSQMQYRASIWDDADNNPSSKWIVEKSSFRPTDLRGMSLRYTPYSFTAVENPSIENVQVYIDYCFAYKVNNEHYWLKTDILSINAK